MGGDRDELPFHRIKIHFSINSSLNHSLLHRFLIIVFSSFRWQNGGNFRQYTASVLASALKVLVSNVCLLKSIISPSKKVVMLLSRVGEDLSGTLNASMVPESVMAL